MSLQYVNPRSLTFFHLRNLSKIRKYLTMEISEIAVHAFVTSKLNLTTVIIYSLVVQNISVTKSAIGSLSKDDGYGNKNVSPKYNLALSQLFRDYSVLFTLCNTGELSCNWMGTNGLKVKTENDFFIVICSCCRQNLKFGYFTLLHIVLWSTAEKCTEIRVASCSTRIFPFLTNHILALWRCRSPPRRLC